MNDLSNTERLDLRIAFGVSVIVWMLLSCGEWLTGTIGWRGVLYGVAVTVALNIVALVLLGSVFRASRARGLPLIRSIVISSASTIPATILVYLCDWRVVSHEPALRWSVWSQDTFGTVLLIGLTEGIGMCLLLSAIVFLPMLARANEERVRELELVQRDAELLRIKSHLEPHFILNSLNAVAGLITEDPRQARELLASLGELFRQASSFRSTHRVSEELEWLRRYVMIHELRYPDRVHTSWDIDESILGIACPALLLQPLVENAIRHGVLAGGRSLTLRARREGESLAFSIEDDGPGPGPLRPEGQGLSIVKRRLALEGLSPGSFSLHREGGITAAHIRIPINGKGER